MQNFLAWVIRLHAASVAVLGERIVAQLNARPTGDQQVADSTPAEVGNILSGDWLWNIFYGHSIPSADSRRTVVSFWLKNVHNTG